MVSTIKFLWDKMKKQKIELFLDTEDNSKGKFLVAVVYNDITKEYKIFKNFLECRKYIISFRVCIVYAHNIGYDIGNIFDINTLSYKFAKGRLILAVYNNNGCYIKFYDTINLIPLSLKKIGDCLNVKKLKMDITGSKKTEIYCQQDVKILFELVKRMKIFYNKYNIKMGYTLSQNALKIFRKMITIKDLQLNQKYDNYIRQAYYGGRVELFQYGITKKIIYENDINSMYPYIMKNLVIPNWKYLQKYKNLNLNHGGICTCLIKQNNNIPVLPIRTKYGLMFCNGFLKGTWCINELKYSLSHGVKIIKVFSSISTVRKINNFFSDYVDIIYKKKQNAKNDYELLLNKLLLNSLYGKFGFNGDIEEIKKLENYNENFISQIIINKKGDIYKFLKKRITTKYMNVLISAYITAGARIELHKHLEKCDNNLIYCDTDSVHTTKNIYKKSDKLGVMAYEQKYNSGLYVLPKLYNLGKQKIKGKGFKLKTNKDFMSLIETGKIIINRPHRIKTSLKFPEKKINYWHDEIKEIRSHYTKRKVLINGTTEPYNINEIN